MPKILSHTPAWLSRPSSGFDLFFDEVSSNPKTPATNSAKPTSNGRHSRPHGPRRVIAQRGAEVFVAVGNQIRWADLSCIKDDWEEGWPERSSYDTPSKSRTTAKAGGVQDGSGASSHRVLKVSIAEPIRQMIPSPNGDLMAILTSHTVHVAKLPNSMHLSDSQAGPLKMKTFTLGPTTHVLSASSVVSALWHPLGVSGNTLVTISAEAVVRVWELSTSNRWSFDSPTLAIDLKKLVDASSQHDSTSPVGFGNNRGFSLDSVEMEVAAACFGGVAAERENGWASMTLWLAMTEGDVYALCPLLPSKWQPPSTLIPSLSVPIVSTKTAVDADPNATPELQQRVTQQYTWMTELDGQDPQLLQPDFEWEPEVEVYDRPAKPGPIPRLQGPFQLDPSPDDNDDDADARFTDIWAIGAELDEEQLLSGEDEDIQDSKLGRSSPSGLSLGVLCLLTNRGRVHVCLDTDGVEGKWLPKDKEKIRKRSFQSQLDYPSLLTLESIDLLRPSDVDLSSSSWPVFSQDPLSPYSLFVTHNHGVSYLSFDPWIEQLESELRNDADAGMDFRLEIFARGLSTLRERVIELRPDRRLSVGRNDEPDKPALSASLLFQDPDLGYFLLTAEDQQPHAVVFSPQLDTDDDDQDESPAELQASTTFKLNSSRASYPPSSNQQPRRPFYQPPASLWTPSPLPDFMASQHSGRHGRAFTERAESLRLNQTTLTLMSEAHKVISDSTHSLGVAAADLFRWSERLAVEYRDQIIKVGNLEERVEDVVGGEQDVYGLTKNEAIDERLIRAQRRQAELAQKYDALRRKVVRGTGRQLSDKERAWIAEVEQLSATVLEVDEREQSHANGESSERQGGDAWERYQQAKTLASSLLAQARELQQQQQQAGADPTSADSSAGTPRRGVDVPSDIRKAKVAQVMKLLDRESALVDATKSRLERLALVESED